MTSIEPPLAVIAASLNFENLAALTVILSQFAVTRTLTPDFPARTIPASLRTAGVTLYHLQKTFQLIQGLQELYSLALMLVNPRFGRRRNSPPSNPGRTPPRPF